MKEFYKVWEKYTRQADIMAHSEDLTEDDLLTADEIKVILDHRDEVLNRLGFTYGLNVLDILKDTLNEME